MNDSYRTYGGRVPEPVRVKTAAADTCHAPNVARDTTMQHTVSTDYFNYTDESITTIDHNGNVIHYKPIPTKSLNSSRSFKMHISHMVNSSITTLERDMDYVDNADSYNASDYEANYDNVVTSTERKRNSVQSSAGIIGIVNLKDLKIHRRGLFLQELGIVVILTSEYLKQPAYNPLTGRALAIAEAELTKEEGPFVLHAGYIDIKIIIDTYY